MPASGKDKNTYKLFYELKIWGTGQNGDAGIEQILTNNKLKKTKSF